MLVKELLSLIEAQCLSEAKHYPDPISILQDIVDPKKFKSWAKKMSNVEIVKEYKQLSTRGDWTQFTVKVYDKEGNWQAGHMPVSPAYKNMPERRSWVGIGGGTKHDIWPKP